MMQHFKSIFVILIICLIISVCNGACSSSKTGKIKAKSGLNMRSGPSTSYSKIITIPYAKVVQLDCWKSGQSINGNNQWVKVCYGSKIGYVADHYVNCGGYCKDVHNLPVCGSPSPTSKLSCPVKASAVTLHSPYGDGRNHKGIDVQSFGKKVSIYSAMSGKVTTVVTGKKRGDAGYGNVVYIDHAGGVQTRYAHLDTVYVRKGDTVSAGQKIGLMGNSGNTRGQTGIHLHFEWRVKGNAVNPCPKLSSVCSFC